VNDIETIFSETLDSRMDNETLAEANDKTIPAGTYRVEVTKKEITTAGDQSPFPGRLIVRVQADALAKQEDGSFKRRGKVFFDVSPVTFKNEKTGRIDSATKLWANLLNIVGKQASNRDAFEYLGQYPMRATINRPYRTVEGTYVNPTSKEQEDELIAQGAEAKNFVQSLGAFNG
jgi:hypothetical protein